ncbi:hypothetical protein MGN01_08830 [Methylobacterium gnaphalii]|uniref:DUF4260 domain-containing protein n=1 Tax=Methylobacterium gnaphalii TaxID=1010610 RepID=A0A512JGF8_9HYPH|nr:hypothetical protein MGN01_08830 [Methylobacterium gnaphalii]GLS48962.1 hypothetical protein GCM10007885_18090 [Methylobacterium gnaphalii]
MRARSFAGAENGIVSGWPQILLRLEGLSVLIASSVSYAWYGGSWWLFAALFFLPDLSMAGYLAGRRTGAASYNLVHWYVLPLACITWAVLAQSTSFLNVGLIWAAHIGFDRGLGYGLKYPEGFGVSHLGLMGKAKRSAKRAHRL